MFYHNRLGLVDGFLQVANIRRVSDSKGMRWWNVQMHLGKQNLVIKILMFSKILGLIDVPFQDNKRRERESVLVPRVQGNVHLYYKLDSLTEWHRV